MSKRRRVKMMRRVLREHGSPVPKQGCMIILLFLASSSMTAGFVLSMVAA